MSTKTAVLSDTHGLLRPEVPEGIQGCDLILHGGDINRKDIIERLEEIAPVYVVRGNNDKEWAEDIPESVEIQIEDCRFFMVHIKSKETTTL
ncbi:MAG: metallophosphoesterase family protein [Bulleidia sp.]